MSRYFNYNISKLKIYICYRYALIVKIKINKFGFPPYCVKLVIWYMYGGYRYSGITTYIPKYYNVIQYINICHKYICK